MSDEDKIDEAKRLCAAVEEKEVYDRPRLRRRWQSAFTSALLPTATIDAVYVFCRRKRQRRGSYSIVREILAAYLNTGDVADLQLPKEKTSVKKTPQLLKSA